MNFVTVQRYKASGCRLLIYKPAITWMLLGVYMEVLIRLINQWLTAIILKYAE